MTAEASDPLAQKASQLALTACSAGEQARTSCFHSAWPCRRSVGTRYGMAYGPHVDTAFLRADEQPMRCDVSCTMFVSDPSTYEGGSWSRAWGPNCAHQGNRASGVLSVDGDPSVAPVTAGERLWSSPSSKSDSDQLERD